MARTQGHGNPNWTRDETILALDLYFHMAGKVPSAEDSKVRELSNFLRNIPYHEKAAKQPSFRNPDGVAFKLQNIRQVATGKGLGNVSKTDREVWAELGSTPAEVKRLATLIRASFTYTKRLDVFPDIEEEFTEGKLVTATHIHRERSPSLRAKLLSKRHAENALRCDMCGSPPMSSNIELQDAQFEAHHIIPLAVSVGERSTRLSDLALLCATCHRLLHRAIAIEKRWLTIAEGKQVCGL